jgi:hypothetical protein
MSAPQSATTANTTVRTPEYMARKRGFERKFRKHLLDWIAFEKAFHHDSFASSF